jgi:hypothetical protein
VPRSNVLALSVLAESNVEYNPRTAFEQGYLQGQRQEPSNIVEGVLVQLLSGYIRQTFLHYE